MKSYHKYKLIIFACTILLIFQTGCGNDSSKSTVLPTSTHDTKNTEMNLEQIQSGDYSSLLGTWKEIAYTDNMYDGRGLQWHMATPERVSSTISVSPDKIKYNESVMIFQGNTLTDADGSHLLSFFNDGTSLSADLSDPYTRINWNVSFYPKGVSNNLEPNNGVKIDNTKNLIVVYYSGSELITVFEQE